MQSTTGVERHYKTVSIDRSVYDENSRIIWTLSQVVCPLLTGFQLNVMNFSAN